MNADGLQQFVGGVSRQEGHEDMLENNHQESLSCWRQKWEKLMIWTVLWPDNLLFQSREHSAPVVQF